MRAADVIHIPAVRNRLIGDGTLKIRSSRLARLAERERVMDALLRLGLQAEAASTLHPRWAIHSNR